MLGVALATLRVPAGLAARGTKLWRELTKIATFNPAERVLLEEACRIADRLDKLDALLTGELEHWIDLRDMVGRPDAVEIHIDAAMSEARQQANVLKQLIAALRIPDDLTAKRPQQRGGGRGAYTPSPAKAASKAGLAVVSSIDRARARGG